MRRHRALLFARVSTQNSHTCTACIIHYYTSRILAAMVYRHRCAYYHYPLHYFTSLLVRQSYTSPRNLDQSETDSHLSLNRDRLYLCDVLAGVVAEGLLVVRVHILRQVLGTRSTGALA